MLFEFICGSLPYGNNATDPYGIFAEIKSHPLKFPSFVQDQDAQSVIRRLLSKNLVERSVNNGFNGIKKMKYFSTLEWENLASGKIQPPYVPKKFRNINANHLYKSMKGDSFLKEFYKTQNTKNPKKNKLLFDNAEIQVWDENKI